MDFSKLKKKRGTSADSLSSKIDKMQGGGFKKDERIWKIERDKEGNAQATIRFLPIAPADGEIEGADPWVRIWNHAFKGPGGWYIEKSLTTIGKDDPLGELNQSEWDENDNEAKDRVRTRSRKLRYVSNVYIVSDKSHPENEGKVMLFEYGQKIFDKIKEALKPKFEDDPKFDPFDLWEGANFKMRVFTETKGKMKFPNYDKSSFDACDALFESDDELEAVWKQCHSLQELLDEKNFKTYDQLKKQLEKVLKEKVGGGASAAAAAEEGLGESQAPSAPAQSAPAQPAQSAPAAEPASSEADDSLDFFKDLANS